MIIIEQWYGDSRSYWMSLLIKRWGGGAIKSFMNSNLPFRFPDHFHYCQPPPFRSKQDLFPDEPSLFIVFGTRLSQMIAIILSALQSIIIYLIIYIEIEFKTRLFKAIRHLYYIEWTFWTYNNYEKNKL